MRISPYTRRERTELNYTVGQAVANAERRLRKIGIPQTCVNAVSGRAYTDKITLEELNGLADRIYDDSVYRA